MRRAAAWACPLLFLAGCGDRVAIPETDLAVEVVLGTSEVETGRGFDVTVVRTWDRRLEPSPWDDGALSPLVLRDVRRTQRADDRRVQETLQFRAHAFTLENVTVAPVAFVGRPRDGGSPRIATSGALRLQVRPTLDPAAPGPPEGPGPRPPVPTPAWGWFVALTVLLAALGLAWARARRRVPVAASAGGEADLAWLTALRGHAPGDDAGRRGDVLAVAELVRRRAGQRVGAPGRCRTTPELSRAFGRATPAGAALEAVLVPADHVKFARRLATGALREEVLVAAEAFVRATPEPTP